jgi:hypothetical protein
MAGLGILCQPETVKDGWCCRSGRFARVLITLLSRSGSRSVASRWQRDHLWVLGQCRFSINKPLGCKTQCLCPFLLDWVRSGWGNYKIVCGRKIYALPGRLDVNLNIEKGSHSIESLFSTLGEIIKPIYLRRYP